MGVTLGGSGIHWVLALLALGGVSDQVADRADRLYGRIETTEGRSVEGYLRWDRNEANWTDVLDGLKEIPEEWGREAESLDPAFAAKMRQERSLVAFGVRLTWDVDDEAGAVVSASGLRFVHLRTLEVVDRRTARLTLTSGEEVLMRSSSTDLGRAMRALEVEEPGGRTLELEWEDLVRVDFVAPPTEAPAPRTRRLHGVVETWSDLELSGYVSWDLDEIFETDILDGRGEGDDHEIPFAEIARIEWVSDRSARVFLHSGRELELRGTNDVDRDNRGIEVSDPVFGRAIIPWEEFKSVTFTEPDGPLARPGFAPGQALAGVVYAVDGRVIEGEIRWDNDEVQAWESLDGWLGDISFDIEFGAIAAIDRVADDRVEVLLVDGRRFELSGTRDVDERNMGVFVKPDGRARRLVRWLDLDRVVFER